LNLEELKEKCSCDYTLGEQIFCTVMVAVAVLCLLFDIITIIAAAVVESLLLALLAIPITLLGAVVLAVLMYIDYPE